AELVLPTLRQADLRFGQCERTYTERTWVDTDPDAPRGPQGKRTTPFSPRLASVFKTAGIDVISMASNHTMDWGGTVLMDSIELFRGWGKQVIGAGRNIAEARQPAIVECNGVKIAFLGYCSVVPEGHEAGKDKPGCAPMRVHTYYQRGG